ncbi:MAG: hypothetical protein IKW74_05320 [Thermoguttaceae bacterium]|nr:hypothetical protein [Thermoguttaceae bacterium]
MKTKSLILVLFCVCAMALVGCNSKPKVTGKVTFPDGKPLTVGCVNFQSETTMARGDLDENGQYSLSSEGENDGVEAGTYQVFITSAMSFEGGGVTEDSEVGDTGALPEMATNIELIDPIFNDPATSGLVCTVKGNTTFDIKVYKPGEAPEAE